MWPVFTTFQRDFMHLEFKTKQKLAYRLSMYYFLKVEGAPHFSPSTSQILSCSLEPVLSTGAGQGSTPFHSEAPGGEVPQELIVWVSWKGPGFSNNSILTSELASSP